MPRHYIKVPFVEKDEAKKYGAKWDAELKLWYYTKERDAYKFSKWIAVPDSALKKEPQKKKEEPKKSESKKISVTLSSEQEELIEYVKQGKNVLVDACIGSGKTTTIQELCNQFPQKRILYLTYNRLLKVDAQEKIHNRNVFVTNYHGFAYRVLSIAKIKCGISDLIQVFLREKENLKIPHYDLLVLDEYQDIEQEIADMLDIIKEANPGLQIVAVGDMKQKIYDKTTLDVPEYISRLLEDYVVINFTKCFRLSKDLAKRLGDIWNKKITGVNESCEVEQMTASQAEAFIAKQDPSDILCLGSRNGKMTAVLNNLEKKYPEKFNKGTVYASIKDEDRGEVSANNDVAIFTTYDSSKGLERRFCIIFDYTESYWQMRLSKSDTRYKILRNIFCVASSRGKEKIIYVKDAEDIIKDKTLGTPVEDGVSFSEPFMVSDMYSFKYKEDVEACYKLLDIEEVERDNHDVLNIKSSDELIDLSVCIGILQEASYFKKYDIDQEIEFQMTNRKEVPIIKLPENPTIEEKVLALTALETGYTRYVNQVKVPFVSEEEVAMIHDRLSKELSRNEEVQKEYYMPFICTMKEKYCKGREGVYLQIAGKDDVEKDGIIYELKFVSELNHDHFLQCAMYTVMKGCEYGIIWNVKNNRMYKIKVKDKDKFIACTIKTITKGMVESFKRVEKKSVRDDEDDE